MNYPEAARGLQDFLLLSVPLARAAKLSVESYDGQKLILSAPLDENINDKGTAFGGSLYNVCVSAAWGISSLKAEELGCRGELVVAKAEIEYLRPLRETLRAQAEAPSEEVLQHFQESFLRHGKASFEISVRVKDSQGRDCARFLGKYALLAKV